MESTLLKDEGCTNEPEKLISPQVLRCSDQCYTSGNVTRSIMCLLASAIKHAVLILMILTFLFLVTGDGAVLLPLLALCCGTCFASAVTVKNRKSLMHGSFREICAFWTVELLNIECSDFYHFSCWG